MGDRFPRRGGSESSDEDDEQPPTNFVQSQVSANGEASGGFHPGAIVRVKLRNFVTYHEAEFFLGPNLNMIIGPNGTGKSSLVCAICLGLGYPSSVLGRASAFGEFVKHGSDEAEIEVELQGKPGSRNWVVGLCIKREDNGRKFTINGERRPHKDVQKLMHSLRIQIDNLCQFLPQDRVAEFAGISPVDLLQKTLQAAAPQEMIEWQAELKQLYKSQQDAQASTEKTREEVRRMEARQQVLQADVEKLRERKTIQEEIDKLEKLRPIVAYHEARAIFREAKAKKVEAVKDQKRLRASVQPALEAVDNKKIYQNQVKLVVTDRKQRLQAAEKAADDALGRVGAVNSKLAENEALKEAERSSFETQRKEKAKVQKRITDLKGNYRQKPKNFDPADWRTKIKEQEHRQRERTALKTALEQELREIVEQSRIIKTEGVKIEQELEQFETQQGQRELQLKNFSPEIARGWEWLVENRDQFEKEVFGPPMLSCSIKDERYSDAVQSLLQRDDFMCFTAQTPKDFKTLSDQFQGAMGISASLRTSFEPLSSYKPPLPKEQLRELGLDGYAIDYLEGPEPVLAMLCFNKKLHTSAVAIRDISDQQFQQIRRGERINNFAAGNKLYRITRRREYGDDAASARMVQFNPGHWWKDQPVDAAEKEELLRKRTEKMKRLNELKQQHTDKKNQMVTVNEELAECAEELKRLTEEKSEAQRVYNSWMGIPQKIELEEAKLPRLDQDLAAAKARIRELDKAKEKITLDTAKAVLEHFATIGRIRTARKAYLDAQLILLEADSDVATLTAKNAEIHRLLAEKEAEVKKIEADFHQLKAKTVEAQEAAQAVLAQADDQKDELLELAKDHTNETIDRAIGAERAKLDVIQASNPTALEEYERYAARIEREQNAQARQEGKLAEVNESIDKIRSQWEPRLDELVSQINDAFSYNFEQINCAGEVSVYKDEDFEKWAIEIKVMFRQGETLQRLDQHRQSGGERAVSTIFYLMALQSLAQAPFRVVDEINQGMDPRNERMVHERMVEVACRQHTSQYFLITPKLLSGLKYDEKVKVHTIVSGEYVDDKSTKMMNFAKFVKIQRSLKGY